jgi:transcriptional regulator with XRE-family HTH domain
MEKPNKSLYGYEYTGKGDDVQGGWTIEGGEQAYYNALDDYEKSKDAPVFQMTLAKAIKTMREKKGLSIPDLAQLAMCNTQILERIEHGYEKRPSLSLMSDLSESLKIPLPILSWVTLQDGDVNQSVNQRLIHAFEMIKPHMDKMIEDFFI